MNERNLTTANRRRTREVAHRQVALARRARGWTGQESLERVLQLRIDHPTASLATLASLHKPVLSKDQFAGRLRRALAHAPQRLDTMPLRPYQGFW